MATYIISDTHFSHFNIIAFCSRPFGGIHEMNEALVERWNNVVTTEDTVIHLGDVTFQWSQIHFTMNSLNRKELLLVPGNHDKTANIMKGMGFDKILCMPGRAVEMLHGERRIVMAHRPTDLPDWRDTTKVDAVRLCGHVHDQGRWLPGVRALNMSCEEWDYTPTLIETAIKVYDEYNRSVT